MKKLIALIIGAAAACGCSNVSKPTSIEGLLDAELAGAKTFGDTLAAIDGTFIGGIFNNRYRTYSHELIGSDKQEMIRGIRTVMAADTANISYISGLQMGLEIMEIYREHAATENLPKEKLLNAITAAFSLDSLNLDQLRELQATYRQMAATVEQRALEREQAPIFNSEQARENRMMGDAVIAKYKTNPNFEAVGSDGLLRKTVTPGSGEFINPNLPVTVAITERRADSGEVIRAIAPRGVLPGSPQHPVLASVLPYMSVGESAVFIVPYPLAYGTPGDPDAKIGPCETIIAEVTVTPYDK